MNKQEKQYWLVVFPSSLGWFAILGEKDRIKELAFGHPSARAAKKALTPGLLAQARSLSRKLPLVRRLQAYAKGAFKDDFRDIKLDLGRLSVFQRRVLEQCRKIPFGTTLSYGQLAARAGSRPGLSSSGQLHGRQQDTDHYSLPSGGAVKRRTWILFGSRRSADEKTAAIGRKSGAGQGVLA